MVAARYARSFLRERVIECALLSGLLIAAFRKTGDPQIGSKSCSLALSSKTVLVFSYSDRFDHVPIQVIDFSHLLTGTIINMNR